jgi:hypothetical protein
VNWVPKKGIESGWWRRDANIYIPDVAPPWTANSYGFVSPVGGTNTLTGGNYETGNFTLHNGEVLKLLGDSWLWVKGNLNMDGNSTVIMTNSTNHFRLTIYVSGSLSSSGTWSKGVDPQDLIIYGLPTCKVASITTGSAMQAVIYAPSADLNIQGNADFFGSITANTVLMNGTPGFHYDENLGKAQVFRGYIVSSWEEL